MRTRTRQTTLLLSTMALSRIFRELREKLEKQGALFKE